MIESIASAFRDLITKLSSSAPNIAFSWRLKDLQEIFDRFTIWSSNVHFKTKRGKDLEYLLHQSSPDLRDTLKEILDNRKDDVGESKLSLYNIAST